ncbi:MAG: argininosuccinate lyase [Lachnospiraceae bacterium]|nr:argininosuccinate lyase [Lachnospiraceae bacterium]
MAQLWGGRFTKETDARVFAFNASLSFDIRLLKQDIRGSIAHVTMLAHAGILTEEEKDSIIDGLGDILADAENGTLTIDRTAEDVHSLIEAELIRRIGENGKKMHTGRSRNDQVALDMRMYIRDEIDSFSGELKDFLGILLDLMEEHRTTFMPGFTHMQKAQPIVLAHHIGAYFQMFRRDREHLLSLRIRMNTCPLGSGALAGTTFPLNREETAALLEFDGACENSIDGVSDRDYVIEFLGILSSVMMHLSRFSEEIIMWNSDEYRFLTLDDSFSTGSSIMPQKKNPDIAELVRGKTGRVYGALISLMTVMKGIPLAYNKDMQEDKELTFDAIDTTRECIALFGGMLKTAVFHPEAMKKSAGGGFTNATDAADYLAAKGVPFRDAHSIAGRLVLTCIERGCRLEDLSMEDWKEAHTAFESDIYEAVSIEACAARRKTKGAPGAVDEEIKANREYLGL